MDVCVYDTIILTTHITITMTAATISNKENKPKHYNVDDTIKCDVWLEVYTLMI